MGKFILNEEEKNDIRTIYESIGIFLNEDSVFGALARKALAWVGKNEDDIVKLFKTTEIALAKSIDDIVSLATKSKSLTQLDDLQSKLMHFYNPSGQVAGVEAAKKNVVKFLNGYSKSKGKANWKVVRDEIKGIQPSSAASAGSKATTNLMKGKTISSDWSQWKPENIDFTKFSTPQYWNTGSLDTKMYILNKNISSAIKKGNWNLVPIQGFEKFGISNFREFLQKNIDKVNHVYDDIGRWSVNFK
jgi:hypothetical protein